MSSAHTFPLALDRILRAGFFRVKDPGASGVISWSNKGRAVAVIDTAAAEGRTLPSATSFGVDTELMVNLRTAVGALTLTYNTSLTLILPAAGDYAYFRCVAVSTSANKWVLIGSSETSGGAPLVLLSGAGAAQPASGLLMGGGTQANPNTTAAANNFIEFWCQTTAASGAARLAYLQFIFDTDGTASGESLRSRTLVNANIGTAHGAHIGLSYEAVAGGSETSGLGAAIRGTVEIPDVASWAPAGTVCAGMFELFSNGADSDPAGLTELSLLRLVNGGNATGAADVDTDAFLISIQGFTAASGVTNVISNTSPSEFDLTSGALGIRVKIGAGTYYIPAIPAADWN